jgi:hypothetical protein
MQCVCLVHSRSSSLLWLAACSLPALMWHLALQVREGLSEAPGMNPDMELKRLVQRYKLWKKSFKVRAQPAALQHPTLPLLHAGHLGCLWQGPALPLLLLVVNWFERNNMLSCRTLFPLQSRLAATQQAVKQSKRGEASRLGHNGQDSVSGGTGGRGTPLSSTIRQQQQQLESQGSLTSRLFKMKGHR